MIVPRKYMPIISAVGLFCCDKFEETQNKKAINLSKLTKSYFNIHPHLFFLSKKLFCLEYLKGWWFPLTASM